LQTPPAPRFTNDAAERPRRRCRWGRGDSQGSSESAAAEPGSLIGDFVEDLSTSLDGATAARSMHAAGKYDTDMNVFTAYKIGVYLLEP